MNYEKDFDIWNDLKKSIEDKKGGRGGEAYAYPREVWWCSLGVNIGAEIDGKNENFERPVLIMRVYNKHSMLVLPVTSKEKNDPFHCKIIVQAKSGKTGEIYDKPVWVKLTQVRMISNRRLLRKVDVIPNADFLKVKEAFKNYI